MDDSSDRTWQWRDDRTRTRTPSGGNVYAERPRISSPAGTGQRVESTSEKVSDSSKNARYLRSIGQTRGSLRVLQVSRLKKNRKRDLSIL